jgi:hypothetical protein
MTRESTGTPMMNPGGETACCPACDRFIGPVNVCPYCSAEVSQVRPVLRALRRSAIVLAAAGMFFLHAVATRTQPEPAAVGNVVPAMNFALVCVTGTAERRGYVGRNNDYVSFRIADGTGSLRVTAYGRVARDIIEEGLVPAKGDRLEVVGNLNISAGSDARIILADVSRLTVEGGRR